MERQPVDDDPRHRGRPRRRRRSGLRAVGALPSPLTLRAALAKLSGEHAPAPSTSSVSGSAAPGVWPGTASRPTSPRSPGWPRSSSPISPSPPRHPRPSPSRWSATGWPGTHGPGAWAAGSSRHPFGSRSPPSGSSSSGGRRGQPRSSTCTPQPNVAADISATRWPRTHHWSRWPWPDRWAGPAHWRPPPRCRAPIGPWTRSPRPCCGPRPTTGRRGRASTACAALRPVRSLGPRSLHGPGR